MQGGAKALVYKLLKPTKPAAACATARIAIVSPAPHRSCIGSMAVDGISSQDTAELHMMALRDKLHAAQYLDG